jgi:hypothetical protein
MLKLVRFACQIESEAHAAAKWLLVGAACHISAPCPDFAGLKADQRTTRCPLTVPLRMSNSALAYRYKWPAALREGALCG